MRCSLFFGGGWCSLVWGGGISLWISTCTALLKWHWALPELLLSKRPWKVKSPLRIKYADSKELYSHLPFDTGWMTFPDKHTAGKVSRYKILPPWPTMLSLKHVFNASLSGSRLSIQEMWPWDVPEESLTALSKCFFSHPVVLCLVYVWWVHKLKTRHVILWAAVITCQFSLERHTPTLCLVSSSGRQALVICYHIGFSSSFDIFKTKWINKSRK